MKTVKLYDRDHYLREFEAEVVAVDACGVELDRTAFYAEAGGQAGDSGALNGLRVVDTQIMGDRIVHVMEDSPALRPGDLVVGVIDWDRRYR
ncbi:MAG TPA: alanine--tRNA ligase-related protein, partial [Candidatus Krumholzibacteriaceae bacterium]|nr:alanine--tRNA ligase-related protein [Candidatus Krumholzibacteriaceae bacterium]